MASKLDYLKKYISAAPPEEVGPQRKKKKKAVEDKRKGGGLQIIDEDAQVRWQSKMRVQQEEIEDDVPVVVEVEEDNDPLRKFKTKQSGSWASVDASAAQKAPPSGAADVSPPRRRRLDEVADSSPPRRGAPDADSSPPRRRPAVDDADSSPPRRRPAVDAADSSPPRRRPVRDAASPPRRRPVDESNASPPRGHRREDLSPPRRPQRDADVSPPRGVMAGSTSGSDNREAMKIKKMSTGESAGLRSARDVRDEATKRREDESQRLGRMDPSVSGRDADTVYRDKRGRPLEMLGEFMRQQKGEFVPEEEKGNVWGRGIVQEQKKEEAKRRLEEERSRPFARYADDADLDEHYRGRDRWGDPMAALTKKSNSNAPMKPRYKGPPAPPNRFGILPGHRWDGVHRSNGFEASLALGKNERSAKALEAYLWSTEDM